MASVEPGQVVLGGRGTGRPSKAPTPLQKRGEDLLRFVSVETGIAVNGGTKYEFWGPTDFQKAKSATEGRIGELKEVRSEKELRERMMLRDFLNSVLKSNEIFAEFIEWRYEKLGMYLAVAETYREMMNSGGVENNYLSIASGLEERRAANNQLDKFVKLLSAGETTVGEYFMGEMYCTTQGQLELGFFREWYGSKARVIYEQNMRLGTMYDANVKLVAKLKGAESRAEAAEKSVEKQKGELKTLANEVNKKKGEIDKLETRIENLENQIRALSEKVGKVPTVIVDPGHMEKAAREKEEGDARKARPPPSKEGKGMKVTQEIPAPQMEEVAKETSDGETEILTEEDIEPAFSKDELDFEKKQRGRERKREIREKYLYGPARWVRDHAVALGIAAIAVVSIGIGAYVYSKKGEDPSHDAEVMNKLKLTPRSAAPARAEEQPKSEKEMLAGLGLKSTLPGEGGKSAGDDPKASSGEETKEKKYVTICDETGFSGCNGKTRAGRIFLESEVARAFELFGIDRGAPFNEVVNGVHGFKKGDADPGSLGFDGSTAMAKIMVLSASFGKVMDGSEVPGSRTVAIGVGLDLARRLIETQNAPFPDGLSMEDRLGMLKLADEILEKLLMEGIGGKKPKGEQRRDAKDMRKKIRREENNLGNRVLKREMVGGAPGEGSDPFSE